ncbi:hypothetical protein EAI_05742 [Harpegnathos saltator]|uniref:Uncharacterized protein n=1 Tax=Harpegnathos saltator TaxID=610380 RepID=E2C064_HARSA|nr:hypothetical protein EAI_05742 [Harpegnathos saltator]
MIVPVVPRAREKREEVDNEEEGGGAAAAAQQQQHGRSRTSASRGWSRCPMRPLSFENLRRLVGRKKDRNEPSFKRSESFKRISIRKSYLDRGKRRNRLQKNQETPAANPAPPAPLANDKVIQQQQQQVNEQDLKKSQEHSLGRDSITYDEWLQGVSSSSLEKLHEDHVESLQRPKVVKTAKVVPKHNSADANSIAEDLKILELDASPVLTSKRPKPFRIAAQDHARDESNGQDVLWTQESSVEGPPSVSISLGRIWRDAVPVPPASVPPSVAYPAASDSAVHHSLDSALKERKPQPTVARTVSAPEKPVSKDTSSSFGFSLRIAKLADFRPGVHPPLAACDFGDLIESLRSLLGYWSLTGRSRDLDRCHSSETDTPLGSRVARNGLFRRKTPKPSPSVSSEGYFKRTSASRRSGSRRCRGKRTSQRSRKCQQPPRTSSPVWFVPPERRRSRRQRRVWREIRYFPDDEGPILERINDWSSNVSDDQFDDQKLLLSGDFNERVHDDALNSMVSSSLGSFSATSSSSSACPAPKISDFNEDKLFSEELRISGLLARGTTWKPSLTTTTTTTTVTTTTMTMTATTTAGAAASGNYFASSQFLSFLAKDVVKERSKSESSNTGYRCLSSTDSDDDDDDDDVVERFNERKRNVSFPQQQQRQHLKRQKSGIRRRPLRRKSQLKRASGQPVFLVRKCSSLRKRPSKMRIIISTRANSKKNGRDGLCDATARFLRIYKLHSMTIE